MLRLPTGVALVVDTVKVAEPEPPVIVVLSKLAITVEFEEEAVSETVPAKPFTAATLIVYVAEAPAVIIWDVGLADRLNSELLPPPPLDPTVRRGDITQPFVTINKLASNNANLRMEESLSSVDPK